MLHADLFGALERWRGHTMELRTQKAKVLRVVQRLARPGQSNTPAAALALQRQLRCDEDAGVDSPQLRQEMACHGAVVRTIRVFGAALLMRDTFLFAQCKTPVDAGLLRCFEEWKDGAAQAATMKSKVRWKWSWRGWCLRCAVSQ